MNKNEKNNVKYRHVGRPTNAEIKAHNNKKRIKIILVILLVFVIFGGLYVYINKENFNFTSIMGNSSVETIKKIQDNKKYKLVDFSPEKKEGNYYYQAFAEDGTTNYVSWLFKESGFNNDKYKLSIINFYYNGKIITSSETKKNSKFVKIHKKYLDKTLVLKVTAENKKNNKLADKYVRLNFVSSGAYSGKKYNLTDKQLKSIAYLCYKEQTTPRGALFEAALMANRYELYGSKYGNIYNYIRNSGWWYNSRSYMDYPKNVSKDLLSAVKDVLVNGYRPMPKYIDEHDCFTHCNDVSKIVVNKKTYTSKNDIRNKNNYIKNKTIIYNRYGAKYTFYVFPTNKSDPFGYTSTAYNKVK